MLNTTQCARALFVLTCSTLAISSAYAAGGYANNYSPVGSLAGEMIMSNSVSPGFYGAINFANAQVNGLRGEDGNRATQGRDVANLIKNPILGSNLSALIKGFGGYDAIIRNPLVNAGVNHPRLGIDYEQSQTQVNLLLGWNHPSKIFDGNVNLAINIPLIRKNRNLRVDRAMLAKNIASVRSTLANTTNNSLGTVIERGVGLGAIPNPTPYPTPIYAAGVTQTALDGIEAGVMDYVRSVENYQSGTKSGLGDISATIAWSKEITPELLLLTGATVTTPTASFDVNSGVNLGDNRWAITPSIAGIYQHKSLSIASRLAYGINGRNRDSGYKDGNFVAFEFSAAHKFDEFAVGANYVISHQIQDDTLNKTHPPGTGAYYVITQPENGMRTQTQSLTPYFVLPIAELNGVLTASYTITLRARNSQTSDIFLLRFSKAL